MYQQKTTENDKDVHAFIETREHPQKKQDVYTLPDPFSRITGYQPKIWGPSIIGFGSDQTDLLRANLGKYRMGKACLW
jgi:hypothetical protein